MSVRSAKPVTVTLGAMSEGASRRVATGQYASVSEVVRAGLRALDREETALDTIIKARVAEALADTRPAVSHEQVFEKLRLRHEARMSRDA